MVEENTRASSGVRRCTQLINSLPLVNELIELSHLPQHEALALSVTDMSNVSRVREVRETLIRLDRMKLALRLCSACDVETYPVCSIRALSLKSEEMYFTNMSFSHLNTGTCKVGNIFNQIWKVSHGSSTHRESNEANHV